MFLLLLINLGLSIKGPIVTPFFDLRLSYWTPSLPYQYFNIDYSLYVVAVNFKFHCLKLANYYCNLLVRRLLQIPIRVQCVSSTAAIVDTRSSSNRRQQSILADVDVGMKLMGCRRLQATACQRGVVVLRFQIRQSTFSSICPVDIVIFHVLYCVAGHTDAHINQVMTLLQKRP